MNPLSQTVKILFLSDTHLGFDQPLHPRIIRRRRGPDFYAHYLEALEPAFKGEVDCVLHGGDLYYRSRIPDSLVAEAFRPLLELADSGLPVFLVPGNHERGNIRQNLLEKHDGIKVFNKPGTELFEKNGIKISFSGVPFHRENIRENFHGLVEETGYGDYYSDFSFLCVHQSFVGARVGVQNYTFRIGKDVVDPSLVPGNFQAVLSGHIHRYQILDSTVPVLYSGAVTRTSFAERRETKGYCILHCSLDQGNPVFDHRFVPVSSRPMYVLHQKDIALTKEKLKSNLRDKIKTMPDDAIILIRFAGEGLGVSLSAAEIRELAPESMNIEIRYSQN